MTKSPQFTIRVRFMEEMMLGLEAAALKETWDCVPVRREGEAGSEGPSSRMLLV